MTDIAKSSPRFSYPSTALQTIAQDVLNQAKKLGATACETDISDGFGQNVTVRRGEVETIEYNRDKGLSVSIYIGQRRGHAKR
jgi:PmbA protein